MNKKQKNFKKPFSFINANARSIGPKVDSLVDCFDETGIDLAFLTETWLQDGQEHRDLVRDISDCNNLTVLSRNRNELAGNGRQYGGVALVCRNKTCTFSEFNLVNPNNYEILAAVGNVTGVKGKIFAIAAYMPPGENLLRARNCVEYISDLISEAKRQYEDCTIVLAGDFNQWPISDISLEHPDLREAEHGPTRQERKIDKILVNFWRSVEICQTLAPLESNTGQPSDHKMVFLQARFKAPVPKKVSYTYRRYSKQGADKFFDILSTQRWDEVYNSATSDSKAAALNVILSKAMNECFPLKTTVRRESGPPWINHTVLSQIRKRRKVYIKEGRSHRWKAMKKKTAKLVRMRAAYYMETQKRTLLASDAARAFYKNVRAYQSKEKPPNFNVTDLFPGEDDLAVAERLADHFNGISSEFDGLSRDIPEARSLPLPRLFRHEIEKRLRDIKKPKSMVEGDIMPSVVNSVAAFLAMPLTDIYNCITDTATWPLAWKLESVTPIPKKSHPSTVQDLRNISCTQLISKVYESFVLEWLHAQVGLRLNQYGGTKGSGAEHYLIDLWQRTLENLDDPRAASVYTSIDYSKAFNRLDFNHCLTALRDKGACSELLAIVATFLTERRMTVKVGSARSSQRQVLGGVPQGSILGVFLFNVAIDSFETVSPDIEQCGVANDLPPGHPPAQEEAETDVPVEQEFLGRTYLHLPPWQQTLIQVLKYVDDNVLHEKANFEFVETDEMFRRIKHFVRTQNLFRRVVGQAEDKGMQVNALKTNLMCISDASSYTACGFIEDSEGTRIESTDSMKILGFYFSSKPDMSAQVEAIQRKFRTRLWILRHLRHRGFSNADLLQVYRSIILPVHDYCSCVYNSSITFTQSQALERLQRMALKSIYGYEVSYAALLQLTGLSTLKDRRDRRSDNLAAKCIRGRFSYWFPPNDRPRRTRHHQPYMETFARTERLRNSPIYTMRRRLNMR